jgi:hypothetical protein
MSIRVTPEGNNINEREPDESPVIVKITLRGRENQEEIQEISIYEEMTNQDVLEKINALSIAFKFGEFKFNQIEIPYHPKLVGIINTLKKSLPEGTALKLVMNGDVSKILGEIDKASLEEALKDFEQADTITFRSKEDKEEYIKAISNFPNIKIDDSKYQVKPNEYFAKFAKPMNDPNNSGEKPKTPQTPQNKQSNNAKRERRRSL